MDTNVDNYINYIHEHKKYLLPPPLCSCLSISGSHSDRLGASLGCAEVSTGAELCL